MRGMVALSVYSMVAFLPNVGHSQGIAPAYRVTTIVIDDSHYAAGEAINSSGTIAVGAYDADDVPLAFRFDGSLQSLSGLSLNGAYANAINDAGLVVGWSQNSLGFSQPVAWQDSTPVWLGSLGGDRGEARGVNNLGMIVGQSRNALGQTRAFFYTSDAGMIELPMTLGGTRSSANAISDSGYVVGSGQTESGDFRAVRFQMGSAELLDLGTLGGPSSFANGINASGAVVGLSDTANDFRPFFWAPGLGMVDIFANGDLGASFGSAYDVNRFGVVVGFGEINDNFDSNAFAWTLEQGLVNLNDLLVNANGLELFGAAGINDDGQIVGWGSQNGSPVAFLLSPVPEPSSLLLILLVLGGLMQRGYRPQT